jgi:mannose-6-phosphate isomerase-like protein (cupin superfamily)
LANCELQKGKVILAFKTKILGRDIDVIAPDGSEIRLLAEMQNGSFVHCTLPVGGVSKAVQHKTIEEIWFFLDGEGEVWRELGEDSETVTVRTGTTLTIPTGAHFQFRNIGELPLRFVIATMPPWPGEAEAVRVPDHWPTQDG